jgi:hypothetical protein
MPESDLIYIPIIYKRWYGDRPLVETASGTWCAIHHTQALEIVGKTIGRLCCVGVVIDREADRLKVRLPDSSECWIIPDPVLDGFKPDKEPKWVTLYRTSVAGKAIKKSKQSCETKA